MGFNTTPEYETAQARISTLLDQIGEQLSAINNDDEVDGVIAEQDKSDFISKQAELIVNYQVREDNDERDAYIAVLEDKLQNALKEVDSERTRWYKEYQANGHLKEAIKQLTAVLTKG